MRANGATDATTAYRKLGEAEANGVNGLAPLRLVLHVRPDRPVHTALFVRPVRLVRLGRRHLPVRLGRLVRAYRLPRSFSAVAPLGPFVPLVLSPRPSPSPIFSMVASSVSFVWYILLVVGGTNADDE